MSNSVPTTLQVRSKCFEFNLSPRGDTPLPGSSGSGGILDPAKLAETIQARTIERLTLIDLAVLVLATYNCRAVEILGASWKDYHEGKFLILRGAKGSKDIVVRDREVISFLASLHHLHKERIFWPVTYSMLYRHIKINYSHLFDTKFGKRNKPVTHYFRYANVSDIETVKDAALILNHNSKKSCGYYNHKLKES
jgi:integrase